MASSSSGLTYSPQALDPYAVETSLAKEAFEGAGNASQQRIFDSYWLERQANKNMYGQEVEANRQLQQQQMANALREKYIALYKDAGQIPGLADVITAQGGNYGADLSGIGQAAAEHARAENLSKYGTASSGFSTAGMTPEALTTNLGIAGFGERPDIQIAKIRAAAQLAAANAHAGTDKTGVGYSIQYPPNAALGGGAVSASVPKGNKQTADEIAADAERRGFLVRPNNTPPPSQRGGTTSLPPQGGTGSSKGTSTPPANKGGATATPTLPNPAQTKSYLDQLKAKGGVSQQQYDDIAKGGFKTKIGADGKLKVVGAGGTEY